MMTLKTIRAPFAYIGEQTFAPICSCMFALFAVNPTPSPLIRVYATFAIHQHSCHYAIAYVEKAVYKKL